jgi:hypothetical protein
MGMTNVIVMIPFCRTPAEGTSRWLRRSPKGPTSLADHFEEDFGT